MLFDSDRYLFPQICITLLKQIKVEETSGSVEQQKLGLQGFFSSFLPPLNRGKNSILYSVIKLNLLICIK